MQNLLRRAPLITDVVAELNSSGVNMYLRCPKQYEFRYVHGIKEIPGVALLEGSSHHKALEMNNRQKMKTDKDMKPKVLTELFVEDFRGRVEKEETIKWEDENEDKVIGRAKLLHKSYCNEVAERIHPVTVEQPFEKVADVNGTRLTVFGTTDLTVKPAVIDYKTSATPWSQRELDDDLQFSIYAWAENKAKVGLINLVKKGNPRVLLLESRRSPQQKMWALQVMQGVAESIKKGAFPMCSPESYLCSERYCGYFNRCRGRFQ